MVDVDELDAPKGRKPKKQIALRPKLAKAFRYIAKTERRELSDIFAEMLKLWISVRHPKKYQEVEFDDEE